jgi:hypothetical protein
VNEVMTFGPNAWWRPQVSGLAGWWTAYSPGWESSVGSPHQVVALPRLVPVGPDTLGLSCKGEGSEERGERRV